MSDTYRVRESESFGMRRADIKRMRKGDESTRAKTQGELAKTLAAMGLDPGHPLAELIRQMQPGDRILHEIPAYVVEKRAKAMTKAITK